MKSTNGTRLHGPQPLFAIDRDGYIVGQALYAFVREQQKLIPQDELQWSDVEDAKLILLTVFPDIAATCAQKDRIAGRRPARLLPEETTRRCRPRRPQTTSRPSGEFGRAPLARAALFFEERTMFSISMPESFKVGDTEACCINGKPAQLTWRSRDTLVIGADDARQIVKTHVEDGLRCFVCGDADNIRYDVDEFPGEGFVFFKMEEPK